MAGTVLIIEDDERLAGLLVRILRGAGFGGRPVSTAELGLEALAERQPDVVLVDLNLPGMSGLDFLGAVGDRVREIPMIVMSGAGTISTAVEAMRRGAVDFVEKPIVPERLIESIRRATEAVALRDRHERLLEDLGTNQRLVGSSAPMERLRQYISRVARSDARALILGENGTGKELIAAAIHQGSARAAHPFIKLNCSALPEHLLESELFGHEKGAFTGAHQRRRGRFELADRGTLFLDEVGDMPLSMQAKILRALQEGEFERVGGSETVRVDVRVIAATNRDLEAAIAAGTFREDLFYRLNVMTIRPPPLRDRRGDIPELVASFASRAERGRGAVRFSDAALAALENYAFPGNVRELQNLVERLQILAAGPMITAEDVREAVPSLARVPEAAAPPAASAPPAPSTAARPLAPVASPPVPVAASPFEALDLVSFERQRILRAIHECQGRKAEAAALLGMSRATLWRKLKRHGLL